MRFRRTAIAWIAPVAIGLVHRHAEHIVRRRFPEHPVERGVARAGGDSQHRTSSAARHEIEPPRRGTVVPEDRGHVGRAGDGVHIQEARVHVEHVQIHIRAKGRAPDRNRLVRHVRASANPVAGNQSAADEHDRLALRNVGKPLEQAAQPPEALRDAILQFVAERQRLGTNRRRTHDVALRAFARHDLPKHLRVIRGDVHHLGERQVIFGMRRIEQPLDVRERLLHLRMFRREVDVRRARRVGVEADEVLGPQPIHERRGGLHGRPDRRLAETVLVNGDEIQPARRRGWLRGRIDRRAPPTSRRCSARSRR